MKISSKVKKLKFYIAIFVFLPLFGVKCTKTTIEPSPPKTPLELLPPATQTGAGTFGCLVDGEVFVPKGNLFDYPISNSYISTTGNFGIDAKNGEDFSPTIYIRLYIRDGVFNEDIFNNIFYSERNILRTATEQAGFTDYQIDTLAPNFIEIKRLDISNKIVSGLFEFRAVSEDKTDTITVTNGRFDLNNLFIQ